MVGIHSRPGSYSDNWIKLCTQQKIPFRIIDCHSNSFLNTVSDLDLVLWHWSHDRREDVLVALHVIRCLEQIGINVFPDTNTCWHFDDKIAQLFLLRTIKVPHIPTWLFTNAKDAYKWIESATWPKVFKLRCGAGSQNVILVRSAAEATRLCKKAFSRGFPIVNGYFSDIQTRIRKAKNFGDLISKTRRMPLTILRRFQIRNYSPKEIGYVYFQEFLPSNNHDTRVTVIGDRAFAFLRINRPNDFRASGSGSIIYDTERIDIRCIHLAFQVITKLNAQCLAFDFIYDSDGNPTIVEFSYGFMSKAVYACPGYWDRSGHWHSENMLPEAAILETVLRNKSRINSKCIQT